MTEVLRGCQTASNCILIMITETEVKKTASCNRRLKVNINGLAFSNIR